jgi:hypothetical protein
MATFHFLSTFTTLAQVPQRQTAEIDRYCTSAGWCAPNSCSLVTTLIFSSLSSRQGRYYDHLCVVSIHISVQKHIPSLVITKLTQKVAAKKAENASLFQSAIQSLYLLKKLCTMYILWNFLPQVPFKSNNLWLTFSNLASYT